MKLFSTPLPFYAADDAPAAAAPDAKIEPPVGDPPAPAPDKSNNFLDGADDPANDKPIAAPVDWPEDWRAKMGGEDKDVLKKLERYKSPADVARALREAEKKIGSGKTVSDEPMPDPEKEPEKAKEWRAARGVPDDPTGYAIPEAVKSLVTDADKPKLADFTEAMHKRGVPSSAVGPVMEWYFQEQAAGLEAMRQSDRADAEEAQEALRSEWGADFRANSTVAQRFAREITPDINWLEARLPSGQLLGSHPGFVKAMADLGLREYGDVAFAGGEQSNKTTARKEEIERMMTNDPAAYRADPKLAQEYQQIMEAEIKRNARQR